MPFGNLTFGNRAFGATAVSVVEVMPTPVPEVTAVLVTPVDSVSEDGEALQFAAEVQGYYGPSQAVTWSVTIGSVDATGRVTGLIPGDEDQLGTVFATSVLDPTKKGSAVFVVKRMDVIEPPPDPDPEPDPDEGTIYLTISVQLGEVNGPAANLSNLMVSFHAASGPHATGQAIYQSNAETTDSSGRLSFAISSKAMGAASFGLLAVLAPDGRHYLGLVEVK